MLNDEQIMEEKRRKQIAIIKASNELIKQSKERMLMSNKVSDLEKAERAKQMDSAITENFDKARSYLGAGAEEVNDAQFKDADPFYKEKYKQRLELRGMTDEQMHDKSGKVKVVVNAKKNIPKGRRGRKHGEEAQLETKTVDLSKIDDDVIEHLDNEEELMKASMINTKSDMRKVSARHERELEQGMNGLLVDTLKQKKVIATEENIGRTINADTPQKETVRRKSTKPITDSEKTVKATATVTNKRTPIVDEDDFDNVEEMTDAVEDVSENNETINKADSYKFDFDSIPSYVQYDVIPLPSRGECYPHKKGKIPVSYLTASDENIIASPNMYRDGKVIDVILKRKILDKSVDVDELCKGDRDAIVLWLRSTGYGPDFPITVTNPNNTEKKYDLSIDLRQFEYLPFNLKGDENGWFEWKSSKGDVLKFKYLSSKDEKELRDELMGQATDVDCAGILINANFMEQFIKHTDNIDEDRKEDLMSCVEDIRELMKDVEANIEKDEDTLYLTSVTTQMIKQTMAVNGNTDREYIKMYIENMRAKDANDYRNYITDNIPGVDFNMTVDVPESDGGGSFDTFLRLDNYVFANI